MRYQKSVHLWLPVILLLTFVFPIFGADSHPFSVESLAKGLPDKIGNEWKAVAPSRNLSADKLPDNSEAKILIEYGLQEVTTRTYSNGKDKITVEAVAMKYASGAYGLWTFRHQTLPSGQKEFFHDHYLLRISAATAASAEMLMVQMQSNLPPTSDLPLLSTYLPDQNKIPASEKYLVGPEAIAQISAVSDLKQAVDFIGGTHAILADYNNGGGKMSIILIEFQSPQFATDGLAKIQQHFNTLSPEEQKRRVLRRVGNYAVEAVNVLDSKAAEDLIGQIKYMARVHWEGRGMSAVPLQFRPPDPVALREVIQTGQFIVAAFYWIGILVIGAIVTGVFTGGAFFYWRRAQRRKLGVDVTFSDAGGMTRLNLDEFLLSNSTTSSNLLREKE